MQISSQRSSTAYRDLHNLPSRLLNHERAQHAFDSHHDNHRQPPLLALPAESLNHITKYLDTQALFSISRTCKALHEHVKDDNTWHSAFNCQFLDEDSGYEAHPRNEVLLRRIEDSWMKEFVFRSNILR